MKPTSFTWQFLMPISSLLLILSFYVPVVSGQCLSDQQSLLLHLKNSLVFNDSLSTKLVQWHKNTGCCSWEGVTCSEGRVIGLDLSSESVSGGLDNSSSLFSLHHLQNLSLAFNDFHFARIPSGFGKLTNLRHLNLSCAEFAGQIPTSLANLTPLESLDLSSNKLKGGIPIQLAENLIFLSVLNLSFNQLVGKIPMTKQFATFSEDSYKGNKGLCGFPLRKDCNAGGTPPSAALNSISKKVIKGNFLSAEIGYIFGFGIVIIPLMFWKRWRFWYLQQLDNILCKIFPKLYVARKAYPRRIIRRNQRPRR